MNINDSLIKTVGNNGSIDIIAELGEITLDSIIDNEILKEIPIIGTLRSLYKITHSVSDYLFLKKLLYFLLELGKLTNAQKFALKQKLETDKD